ncbi:hypothetical protein GHT06_015627 [Daphnia sinensis]|uniref:Saposin A-type domain-containing protein n=1 Tax=Daphnia sinensis TaxID=1820382 RepID=A0AAD5PUT1_9CRUS|nr:hypothetical protein GHT06_015627 [Daphnia sinensis]
MRSLLILFFCIAFVAVLADAQLLGSNPCTFGPAFWCASLANAQRCGDGAVAHCNRVGWQVAG